MSRTSQWNIQKYKQSLCNLDIEHFIKHVIIQRNQYNWYIIQLQFLISIYIRHDILSKISKFNMHVRIRTTDPVCLLPISYFEEWKFICVGNNMMRIQLFDQTQEMFTWNFQQHDCYFLLYPISIMLLLRGDLQDWVIRMSTQLTLCQFAIYFFHLY